MINIIYHKIGKYNFKIISKIIEKYMTFTIQQPKRKDIKPGIWLVFIDIVHFLNISLDDLVKKLREIDFHYLCQQFKTNVLDLLKKKALLSMTAVIILKNSKTAYAPNTNFRIY